MNMVHSNPSFLGLKKDIFDEVKPSADFTRPEPVEVIEDISTLVKQLGDQWVDLGCKNLLARGDEPREVLKVLSDLAFRVLSVHSGAFPEKLVIDEFFVSKQFFGLRGQKSKDLIFNWGFAGLFYSAILGSTNTNWLIVNNVMFNSSYWGVGQTKGCLELDGLTTRGENHVWNDGGIVSSVSPKSGGYTNVKIVRFDEVSEYSNLSVLITQGNFRYISVYDPGVVLNFGVVEDLHYLEGLVVNKGRIGNPCYFTKEASRLFIECELPGMGVVTRGSNSPRFSLVYAKHNPLINSLTEKLSPENSPFGNAGYIKEIYALAKGMVSRG